MVLSLRRHPKAQDDIEGIWLTIARDNPPAAERLVTQLYAAEDRLALFPELGRRRDDLRPGLRMWTVGPYLVLYRIEGGTLFVVRVLHGARDLTAALAP